MPHLSSSGNAREHTHFKQQPTTDHKMSDQKTTIKLIHGQDNRIITLERPTYMLLAACTADLLGIPATTASGGGLVFRYRDDEGDLIHLSSDNELEVAQGFTGPRGILRLEVTTTADAGSFSDHMVEAEKSQEEQQQQQQEPAAAELARPQPLVLLMERLAQCSGLSSKNISAKKCAKALHQASGNVDLALAAIEKCCNKHASKGLKKEMKREKKTMKKEKKREKKMMKKEMKAIVESSSSSSDSDSTEEVESEELKSKLDQLEACLDALMKPHQAKLRRKRLARLLNNRCSGDVDKAMAVLKHRQANSEIKRAHRLEIQGQKKAFRQKRREMKGSCLQEISLQAS